jgi:hypothetical protein
MRYFLWLLALMAALLAFGCTRGTWDGEPDPDFEDLENDEGDGPYVLFAPDAEEFAMIPYPNDVAMQVDPTSPTGYRFHKDEDEAKTNLERTLEKHLNELDGFCTFCPIRVTFDRPLDLNSINDTRIYLINVTPGKFFGETRDVDLGEGFFPINLPSPVEYHPNDPHAGSDNQLFADGNRRDCYEDATNTLRIRPLTPLRQQSRYVVVLTKGLVGEDGEPIQPPLGFEYKTFPAQLDDVLSAVGKLAKAVPGFDPDDVAFAWRFTTMSITQPLEQVRHGLYGNGPLAYLADEIPTQIHQIDHFSAEIDYDGNDYVMAGTTLQMLFDFVTLIAGDSMGVPLDAMTAWHNIDYMVGGSYTTPLFLDTPDRIFDLNWQTGEADYGYEQVPFFIAVPKPTAENGYAQPPYPTVLFLHANIRNRLDIIALADWMAAQGIASISIDAAEHGPETYLSGIYQLLNGLSSPPPEGILSFGVDFICTLLIKLFYPSWDVSDLTPDELVDLVFTETWLGAMLRGRSYDYNHDGFLESGQSFFSANMFRSRDIARQTQIDMFVLTRIVNSMGLDQDGDGNLSMYEGDFNQDGVADIGGPGNDVFFIGMSLGSLFGGAFVALEPSIQNAVFNVPGGGLVDILQRTTIKNVVEPIRSQITGPTVVGRPDVVAGQVALTINLAPIQNKFATIALVPGAKVALTNLANDERAVGAMDDAGNFALSVPADEGDLMRLQVISHEGAVLEETEWASEFYGFGLERNTPKGRDFIDNAQWVIDGADPINFVGFLQDPRPGNTPKNALMQFCNPDDRVPIAAGIRLADSAGIISEAKQDRLLALGLFDWAEYNSLAMLNGGYDSTTGSGWRIFPAYNHEFFLAPREEPNSIMFSFFSKNQAGIYLKTHGRIISDDLEALVPEKWYVEGFE